MERNVVADHEIVCDEEFSERNWKFPKLKILSRKLFVVVRSHATLPNLREIKFLQFLKLLKILKN